MLAVKIPSHIQKSGRNWIKKVLSEYEFSQTDLSTLFMAGECLDRLKQVRERIVKDGLQVPDRFGIMKAHPLCAVERDNRLTFVRINKQLGIIDNKGEIRP